MEGQQASNQILEGLMKNAGLSIVLLMMVLVLSCVALYYFRVYKAIAETPIFPIGELTCGLRGVKGVVVATEGKLKSPLTNSNCVYFKFSVIEEPKFSSGTRRKRYIKRINDTQRRRFCVKDASGEVEIEARGANFLLNVDKHTTSGIFDSAPRRLEKTLQERYGQSSRGLVFNRSLSYEETILKPGDRIYVLGHVTGGEESRFARKLGVPFIVSDTSEASLIKKYRAYSWLCWGLAGLLFIFAIGHSVDF